MQKNRHPSINLLGNKQGSIFDKFIDWALTIGRLVVILTEVIALSAFLYRFTLDRQLIDLHSKIKQKTAIVGYLKDREEIYRNLQDRLSVASTFSESGEKKIKIFNDIIGLAAEGMTFNELALTENHVRIAANFQYISSLTSFVNALKNYSAVESVSIEKIENKLSNALIAVSITANLKGN